MVKIERFHCFDLVEKNGQNSISSTNLEHLQVFIHLLLHTWPGAKFIYVHSGSAQTDKHTNTALHATYVGSWYIESHCNLCIEFLDVGEILHLLRGAPVRQLSVEHQLVPRGDRGSGWGRGRRLVGPMPMLCRRLRWRGKSGCGTAGSV